MSKKSGKPVSEVVFEPNLRPVKSGVFKELSGFTRNSLFAQIVYYCLRYALTAPQNSPNTPTTRIEAFLHVITHLILCAVLEDHTDEDDSNSHVYSFVHRVLQWSPDKAVNDSIFLMLQQFMTMDEFKACHPRIRLIMLRTRQRQPQLAAKVSAARGVPMERLGTDSPMTVTVEDLELKKKQALERQARVMAQFQMQQQDFLSSQSNIDWGEDDYDDLESVATGIAEEHRQMWKYPTGNCILCQEETNDSRCYGTFALIMDSNILRQTNIDDPDYIKEVLDTPVNLDRSADSIRPFGVGGQNRLLIRKLASNGQEIVTERQGLGKGYPLSQCVTGPVSTGCGHIMHYKCFELYYSATDRRQTHQIARNHPERLTHKEFVCPLCKALGNAFLPIIWKAKEESFPSVLQTEQSFEDWLSRVHPGGVEGRSHVNYHEMFVNNILGTTVVNSSNRPMHPMMLDQLMPILSPRSARSNMPGIYPGDDGYGPSSAALSSNSESVGMEELSSVYLRLRETISRNQLQSRHSYSASQLTDDLVYSDVLAKALGFSISAIEIAQRGVESEPGTLLLSKISTLSLTHLRIVSETASSYITVGALKPFAINQTVKEFGDEQNRQLLQLFAGHPRMFPGGDPPAWMNVQNTALAAVAQDPFILLAECSVYIVPALNLEIHHMIRVCYLMEIVKVMLTIFYMPDARTSWPVTQPTPSRGTGMDKETAHSFRAFLSSMERGGATRQELSNSSPEILQQFYRTLQVYALPFLRKVVILLHTRYGVDFPNTGFADIEEPELDRLTRALRLPKLTEMFDMVTSNKSIESSISYSMVCGWVKYWRWQRVQEPMNKAALQGVRPSHPAIFELIGLPKYYDTLLDEMMRRRCPTTGKDLVEPALCLFCGDIFCSQAVCCTKDSLGGCNQHMKK
jgi:E3 ubiquitin-protein ligase UBR1